MSATAVSTFVPWSRGCDHPCGAHTGDGPLPATAPPSPRGWLLIEHPALGPTAVRP